MSHPSNSQIPRMIRGPHQYYCLLLKVWVRVGAQWAEKALAIGFKQFCLVAQHELGQVQVQWSLKMAKNGSNMGFIQLLWASILLDTAQMSGVGSQNSNKEAQDILQRCIYAYILIYASILLCEAGQYLSRTPQMAYKVRYELEIFTVRYHK